MPEVPSKSDSLFKKGDNQTKQHLRKKNAPGCLSLTCLNSQYSCINDYNARPESFRVNHGENNLRHRHEQRLSEQIPGYERNYY